MWPVQISWEIAVGSGIAPWILFDLDMFDRFFKRNIDFSVPLIVVTETLVSIPAQA